MLLRGSLACKFSLCSTLQSVDIFLFTIYFIPSGTLPTTTCLIHAQTKITCMKREKLFLFILALTQFTHIIDFVIIMPLGKQLMGIFDITPSEFGRLVSVYAAGSFLTSFFAAGYVDKFDRKQALLFLFIGFTVGTFLCATATNYLFFLFARFITGAFGGVISALVFAIIGDVIPIERRGSAMGWVLTAFSAASILGVPAGVAIAATFGWQATFLSIGAIAVAVIFLIYFFIPPITGHITAGRSQDSHSPIETLKSVVKDSNQLLALVFTVVLMLGHFTIIPFIAPYMQINIGFSDWEVTYIYLIGGILSAILLPIYGKLTDRYGAFNVFIFASFIALFSIYAITNLPPVSIPIALVVTSSFFVASSGRTVPSTTMVTSVVRPETRGRFMSVRSSFREVGLLLGSLAAGEMITENSEGVLEGFEVVGYFTIGMSILAVFIARKLKVVG